MNHDIKDLIEISRFYGSDKNFVIAGGGNSSFKDKNTIWIKASGYPLSDLTEEGLVALSRGNLQKIASKSYSDDPVTREDQVKNDLFNCIIDQSQKRRPSVETSLHEMIRYKFVVHLHPSLVNGVLCSRNAENFIKQNFGDEVLFVEYTDPGYTLFKKLEKEILAYRSKFPDDPQIIFLENHGVFAGAETIADIKQIYTNIITTIEKNIKPVSGIEQLPYNSLLHKVLPGIRMLLSDKVPKVIRYRNNTLISKYYTSQQEYHKISVPLIPDIIVYCKARFLYIEQSSTAEKILDSFKSQLPRFLNEYGYLPKVIVIKDMGVFAIDETFSGAETVLDVYEDNIRISHYALQCGGIKFLTPEQVSFIDQWEVENYRRKIAKLVTDYNNLAHKIVIITGGAQGFGAGIAQSLYRLGLNV